MNLLKLRQRELQRIIKRYSRYDLLILDELGYIPFSREGASFSSRCCDGTKKAL
jgi:DNA replication protein DnaC